MLEHKPQEPWLENIYRPVGNTVAVQQPAIDDEPDEEYERNFQRGLQLLEAKLKKMTRWPEIKITRAATQVI